METAKIGTAIKDRRKELRLSLEDVGKAIGVNKTTVMRWETGDITTLKSSHIYVLSKVLYLPIEVLLGLEPDQPIESGAVVVKRIKVIELLNQIKTIEGLEQAEKYINLFILK